MRKRENEIGNVRERERELTEEKRALLVSLLEKMEVRLRGSGEMRQRQRERDSPSLLSELGHAGLVIMF